MGSAGIGAGAGIAEGLEKTAQAFAAKIEQHRAQKLKERDAKATELMNQVHAAAANANQILQQVGGNQKDPKYLEAAASGEKIVQQYRQIFGDKPEDMVAHLKQFKPKEYQKLEKQTQGLPTWEGEMAAAPRPAEYKNQATIDQIQGLLGRKLTDEEIQRYFDIQAPKSSTTPHSMSKNVPSAQVPMGTVNPDGTSFDYEKQTGNYDIAMVGDYYVATPSGEKPEGTHQQLSVMVPGESSPRRAWVDPKKLGGFLDENHQSLPEGTKSIDPQTLRSMSYGQFGNYYRAAKGQGMTEEDAQKYAGDMIMQQYGLTLGAQEQTMAISEVTSGIPPGPSTPSTPITRSSVVTPPKVPTTAGEAKQIASTTAPKPSGIIPSPSADQRQQNILFYLGTVTGTQSASGQSQARAIQGQQELSKLTGVDPMTLNANLSQNQALAKQLGETVQRTGAIQRLNNTLDLHGTVLEGVAKNVIQSGSPLLNKPMRSITREIEGNPELKRFQIALNAVQREYAYLTAGGAQSRAMLPVTVSENMDKMFSPDSTLAEVFASVDQVRIEAKNEVQALQNTQNDIIQNMKEGVVGQAVGGKAGGRGAGPGAGGQPQTIKIRDPKTGRTGTFAGTEAEAKALGLEVIK
jgi:hypothetical protein